MAEESNASSQQLREQLRALRASLPEAELDDDTRQALRALDADLHAMLEAESAASDDSEQNPLLARAQAAEAEFASNHPVAARFLRDLVDTLSRMGV